ncbi:MAG: hypothetical protein JKY43_04350 [Phycisphaerales bacterium]|nr:hypothetical protein [Phycisphaerales bacterium]
MRHMKWRAIPTVSSGSIVRINKAKWNKNEAIGSDRRFSSKEASTYEKKESDPSGI